MADPADARAPVVEVTAVLETVRPGVVITGMQRLSGGASRETWALRARSVDHGTEELILRRDPEGRPGPPGSMALEASAMRAAGRSGLPVPHILIDDDGSRLGTAGLIMERVPGETIPRRILRDDDYADARRSLAGQCGRFLAGLHSVDPAELPGLEEVDPLRLYRESYDAIGQVSPTFELAFRWLESARPPSSEQVVVHGDFRLGNLIVDTDGLRAAIDWELVHLGDPLEDLAWLCVKAWRFRAPLPVGGFGTTTSLLAAYAEAGGASVDPERLRWWLVLNTLKWGVMCMGQADAHLTGALRSVELAAIGRRACEQEWDLLELLAPEATAKALEDASPEQDPEPPATGLHGRPTAGELAEAVREFLLGDAVAGTEGRLQFHTRVAANVVAIIERQLRHGPVQEERFGRALAQLGADSPEHLARRIAEGAYDDRVAELAGALAASARDKLVVANPRHLALPSDRP